MLIAYKQKHLLKLINLPTFPLKIVHMIKYTSVFSTIKQTTVNRRIKVAKPGLFKLLCIDIIIEKREDMEAVPTLSSTESIDFHWQQ